MQQSNSTKRRKRQFNGRSQPAESTVRFPSRVIATHPGDFQTEEEVDAAKRPIPGETSTGVGEAEKE